MGAVDRKYLELITGDAPYPACGVYRFSVCRHHEWITESSHPRLAFRKVGDVAQVHPRQVPFRLTTSYRGKKKAHNRYSKHHRRDSVEQDSELHEEAAPGKRIPSRRGYHKISRHFISPGVPQIGAAHNSKRNKAGRGFSRGAMLTMQPH